jgi:hypothetical protein
MKDDPIIHKGVVIVKIEFSVVQDALYSQLIEYQPRGKLTPQ